MSGRRIMIVNPNTTREMTDAVVRAARDVAGPGTEIVGATPDRGVDSVESHVDEVWGALGVLREVVRAERDDAADAYVVACFGDTGVPAAKEVARGPVVGMTEAALATAAVLAHRFAIVTMPRRTVEQSDRVVAALGLGHRCAVRAVEVPVSDVGHGAAHLAPLFAEESRAALDAGAEAIVLGCAGLSDLVAPLRAALGVPVIDGVLAAVTMAEGLLAQGLTTSRAATYAPPERLGPVDA